MLHHVLGGRTYLHWQSSAELAPGENLCHVRGAEMLIEFRVVGAEAVREAVVLLSERFHQLLGEVRPQCFERGEGIARCLPVRSL